MIVEKLNVYGEELSIHPHTWSKRQVDAVKYDASSPRVKTRLNRISDDELQTHCVVSVAVSLPITATNKDGFMGNVLVG